MMKTYSAKSGELNPVWFVINVDGKTLGRAASEIAKILMGKNKPEYTRHIDTGDFVIAINAKKIRLTGKKLANKNYYRHSGHPGHLKTIHVEDLLQNKPERVLEIAVQGMLPKNILGGQMARKLKVYGGENHPHEAQHPKEFSL